MVYSLDIYKREHDYKNKKNKILIQTLARNKTGLCTSLNKAYVVEGPYDLVILSQRVKEAFEYAIAHTPNPEVPPIDVLREASGIKDSYRFYKEWLMVWATMDNEKNIYQFIPGKRDSGGHTSIRDNEEFFTLPITAKDEEIGKLILIAFEKSL
jgi:hypothetical protein